MTCDSRTGSRNTWRCFCSETHRIAIPMQVRTQWTHSDIWSHFATTPECLFKIEDRPTEMTHWHCDGRAMCNAMHGINAGSRVCPHRDVSNYSNGVHPLWRSDSAWADICLLRCQLEFLAEPRCNDLLTYWWIPKIIMVIHEWFWSIALLRRTHFDTRCPIHKMAKHNYYLDILLLFV